MFTRSNRVFGVIYVVSAFTASAQADPVTWAFEGEVTLISDPLDILEQKVKVGSHLSGSFTFESSTPTTVPGPGFYKDAVTDVFGILGSIPFAGPAGAPNRIVIWDGSFTSDADSFLMTSSISIAQTTAFLQISLADSTGDAFQSISLPFLPPSLDQIDIDGAFFNIGTSSESFGVNGDITRLVFVPDPTTLLLLSAGVLVVARRRTRLSL